MSRIAVIGAGLVGSRHVDVVRAHPKARLAAVVDPDISRLESLDVPVFASLDQVDVPLDAVILATPTDLHVAHGIAAANRGWHLLIEKPVTAVPEEADALLAAVGQHGVRCLVGHHRRYHPAVKALRDIVRSGRIGQPVTSTLIWATRKPDAYFNTDWRRTGGSPVMINLVHDLDLLRFVLGDVDEMTALGSDKQRRAGRVESGAVALRFASGACGSISFADTAPSPWGFEAAMAENPNIAATGQDMWWITGTRGGVSFPSLTTWGGAADWSEAPTASTFDRIATVVPLVAQLDHFLDVIAGQAAPLVSIEDARESLRLTVELDRLLTTQCCPVQPDS